MVQAFVNAALFLLDAKDRRLRLFLARLLRAQLLFSSPTLDGDLILLASEPVDRLERRSRLELEGDDVLLPVVERGLDRGNRRLRRGYRDVEPGDRLAQAIDGALARFEAFAELLDLPLRRENAARLRTRSTLDLMGSAINDAVAGPDRTVQDRAAAWPADGLGDPGPADVATMAASAGLTTSF